MQFQKNIDNFNIKDAFNTGTFEEYAIKKVQELNNYRRNMGDDGLISIINFL